MRYILATAFLCLALAGPAIASDQCEQNAPNRAEITKQVQSAKAKIDRAFTGIELSGLRDFFQKAYGSDPLNPKTDELWVVIIDGAPNVALVELGGDCVVFIQPVPVEAWVAVMLSFERSAEKS